MPRRYQILDSELYSLLVASVDVELSVKKTFGESHNNLEIIFLFDMHALAVREARFISAIGFALLY